MTEAGKCDPFMRCDPLEVAVGWPYGLLPATALPSDARTPRQALDDAIRPALLNGPCYVTFSGGRDSSAVLAAATALARREGLDLPVPVTRVYPQLAATQESEWQRLMVDHLGLREWIRIELRDGETDLLGAAARKALHARGLLFPAPLQTHGAVFERLGPGSILTGEGGDVSLGARRGTSFALIRRRRISPTILRAALDASLPRPIQQLLTSSLLRRKSHQVRWLKPAALRRHARRAAADIVAEPLAYPAGTWFITRMRSFAMIRNNHAVAAAEYGLRAGDPLLDSGFLAALAHSAGRLGYPGRTATMRALFSDVLPPEVMSRSTKASFNQAHTGAGTRDFARSWDGTGVDHELVDVERLRDVWLSDHPTMTTGLLLHSAWMATEGAIA